MLQIGSSSGRTSWSRAARPSAASLAAALVLLLAVALFGQAPAAAATPASVAGLESRIADLDSDLEVVRGSIAELRSEVDRLSQERDRSLSWLERLLAQRDATAELHRAHLDVAHRRTTTEQVDAALEALLVRSGLADGAPDWYLEQLDALHGTAPDRGIAGSATRPASPASATPPASPDREVAAEGASTAAPQRDWEAVYDPATSSLVTATAASVTVGAAGTAGRVGAVAAGSHGHLQLRYAVRSSLVFAALRLQLEEAELAVAGPQQQLDAGVIPALTAAQDRTRELQEARDRLSTELAEEQRRLERAASRHFPVDGAHRVSSAFGMRRHPVFGGMRMHHGLDLAARTGTPVVAAEPGRVVMAGSRGGYGLVVDIDHGGGVLTRYAHLNSIEVARGDQLVGGQRLGTVGATGTVTGPHLHFEVRMQGRSIDPAQWLSQVPRGP
ncbi:MAG: hypothetical protein EA340_02500 [Nitriliruptor sp.]|nr:MAG: hypothetical protein EA340_02500 [Nitriliruptor sp.]